MAATVQAKTVYSGESRTFRVTVRLESDASLVDLTTATAIEFQVKTVIGGADPALIALAIGTGITVLPQVGLTLGQFDINLLPSHTSALSGAYYYDVVVVLTGGKRYYVVPPSRFNVSLVVNQV